MWLKFVNSLESLECAFTEFISPTPMIPYFPAFKKKKCELENENPVTLNMKLQNLSSFNTSRENFKQRDKNVYLKLFDIFESC